MLIGWLEVSLLVRWLLGWILALSLPSLPASMPLHKQTVSVLIPARNEAATLPHLLAALSNQVLRPAEVIVVDDDSSDGTGAIARQSADTLAIKVIQPPPLPEGWCGKTWALHHGVQASRGDVLVFLDADTEPAPQFLQRLLAQHEQQGGLVSVQPYHRTEKPYEQLSLLFSLVGLMAVRLGPSCGVAFGPAMVSSRADYLRAGGHEAVADKVVEDWFLAHLYEKLWLSGLFWAAWCLPAALLGWPLVGTHAIGPNALIYGAFAVQLLLLSRRVGRFHWINLIFPIPVLFFLGVFILAIFKLERGHVEWKGRRFKTR